MLQLKWICCKHSNNLVQQADTPGKAAFLLHDKFILSCDITFILNFRSRYTMTEKQVDAAINILVNYCDMLGLVVPYKKIDNDCDFISMFKL